MKFKIRKILTGVALALCASFTAHAQVTPSTVVTLTTPAVVNAATVSNVTTAVITLHKDAGLALQTKFAAMAASTANMVVYLYPSVDGTNYSTTGWPWIMPANGTTPVVGVTNWSAAQLRGFATLKLGAITNAHASVAVTNLSVIYNRPNY